MPTWFDEFTAGVETGERRYLACDECGHATLPPRRVCPDCGSSDLSEKRFSETASIMSFTEISVTIPRFRGETPYTMVVAEFPEGFRLTGQLRNATADDVAVGDAVSIGVEPREDGPSVLTFRPTSA